MVEVKRPAEERPYARSMTWEDPAPRTRELIRQAAERALQNPDEWVTPVHEATLSDALAAEASDKRHSTTKEAIESGIRCVRRGPSALRFPAGWPNARRAA